MKIPLYHNSGDNPCYKLLCYYTGKIPLRPGDVLHSCAIELLDKTIPEIYSVLLCGSCGKVVTKVSAFKDQYKKIKKGNYR